jgi:hypothetical protein
VSSKGPHFLAMVRGRARPRQEAVRERDCVAHDALWMQRSLFRVQERNAEGLGAGA